MNRIYQRDSMSRRGRGSETERKTDRQNKRLTRRNKRVTARERAATENEDDDDDDDNDRVAAKRNDSKRLELPCRSWPACVARRKKKQTHAEHTHTHTHTHHTHIVVKSCHLTCVDCHAKGEQQGGEGQGIKPT